MLMFYILCKIVILQSNVVHHLLTKPFQEGLCRCWINFIRSFTIPLKTLWIFMVVGDHLLKELTKCSNEYINLFGGIDIFEELKRSLLVTMDKWMDITEMEYVIASRYNVIIVSLSLQQSMTFFPLRSQPPTNSSVHRIICIGHIFGNHFVYLRDCCPLPPLALLWSRNCHPQTKQWPTPYISRMHQCRNLVMLKRDYVDLSEE
ncbi:hypothetical protein GmHk_19G054729 [Glycine max]|nr:hypothetical protein GmHk_19G054729 [Glycine max]